MTGIPLIGVLAVQGDVREHVVALRISGARTITVRRPEEVAQVDGLVIPGGESTTMDKLVRAFGLQGPLRERIAAGMPVYGSCAGMIMLADRIADWDDRLAMRQATLERTYTAMEVALSTLTSQQAWLSAQIEQLNANSGS